MRNVRKVSLKHGCGNHKCRQKQRTKYVQRTVNALFSKRYDVCWCKTEQRKHTKDVISDEWETLKPKEKNVKKRETPSLALGIRKYFLMGKIWQPGLEAHERLWDSSVVVIAFVLFCKVSSSIVYVVRNSELYVFGEAALISYVNHASFWN